MNIARGEDREMLYWLRLVVETAIVEPTRVSAMVPEADEIVSILTAVVKNARNADNE